MIREYSVFVRYFIIVLFGMFVSLWSSQSDGYEWVQTFGGRADDAGYSVQQTKDGGYIITGYTESYGEERRHVFLLKTDSSGNKEWGKIFGGGRGYCVQQTKDGGYIIVGDTSKDTSKDVYLIKTDGSGNEEWSKTFGGAYDDGGRSVQQTSDGGYIIAGHTTSFEAVPPDMWLIKTDGSGNEEWTKTFGGTGGDEGHSVQQTSDGGYIITGNFSHYTDGNIPLIKTDGAGNTEWVTRFGEEVDDPKHFEVGGYSVQQTKDGGYIMTGCKECKSGYLIDLCAFLIKTNHLGGLEWSKTFDNTTFGRSVHQTTDGGYIITGYEGGRLLHAYDVLLIYFSKDEPVPDIKANGSDGPVTISPSDNVNFTLWLDPGDYMDQLVDYGIFMSTPQGWYTLIPFSSTWVPGISVSGQKQLTSLSRQCDCYLAIPGEYEFYFAVDNNADNVLDRTWEDSVQIIVK